MHNGWVEELAHHFCQKLNTWQLTRKKERKKVRLNAGEKETLTKYFCYDFQNYAMSNKDSLNVQLDSKR